MIVKKGNTHLVRALREQIKAQRELIAALEERIRIQEHSLQLIRKW